MLSVACRIRVTNSLKLPVFARNRTTTSLAGPCRRFPPLRTFSTVNESSRPRDTPGASEDVILTERNTLFIGRLPHIVRKDHVRAMLRALFRRFGRITSIKVATDLQGNPRQYAHITFENPEHAAAAFKHSEKERFVMKERVLNVDMAPVVIRRTEDVNRQLHFSGLEGDERTIRRQLTPRLNKLVDFITLNPPNEDRTRDGCIQFSLRKWAVMALQRLQSRKKRKQRLMFNDMWHALTPAPAEEATPSLVAEEATSSLAAEAATPSPAAEPSSPTSQLPDESLEKPKSAEDLHVRQLFIGCLPVGLSEKELCEQLKQLFQPFGKIRWLRIGYGPEHNAKDNPIPFCHLEFVHAQTALDAFSFSRREGERVKIKGQKITIGLKEVPRPSNTLYFRAYFGSRLALWDTVRDFEPNIRRIVFFNDRSGKQSGDGQIEFKTLEYATEALPELHGRIAKNGTRLLLSYHRPSRRGMKAHRNNSNEFNWLNRPGTARWDYENEPKSETV